MEDIHLFSINFKENDMIEIESKVSLSQELIEKIVKDYIEKNSKFTPESFKFNIKKDSGSLGYSYEQHVFDDLTVSVKLKD